MNHQGGVVGRVQLMSATPQPRTDYDRQVGGPGSHKADKPGKATYPNDMSQDGDVYPIDNSFRKFQMAQQNAKRTLEKEKILNMDDKEEDRMYQTESEDADGAEFMNIHSNPDPAVFYTIIDETPNAHKSNKKKKKKSAKKEEDLLVESIKRALSENKSVSDDSYTQFSHGAVSIFTDAELGNSTSSTMSSSSYNTEDSSNDSVDVTLMSQSLERNYHQSKDEETLDSATTDEETLLSDYTEQTSSVAVSPIEKQERTQSVDDDHSCDDTYDTRGTVGLVQDVLTCGTYRFCMGDYCMGDDKKYLPEEDHTIRTKRSKDSRATDTTPPTSHLTVKKRSSSKSLATAAEMAKDEDVVFQEEEDANAIAETLHKIFCEGDGVVSEESSNTSEKNDNLNGSLDVKPTPKSNENALPATSEANNARSTKRKPNLRSAAKSLGKSISNRRQKSSATQQLPIETGVNEGHAIVTPPSRRQKNSTTREHRIEIDVDEGQPIVSPPFSRQQRSAIQQSPIEFDVDEDQTIQSLPILQSESHHSEANINFVQATEPDLQRRQNKTQGYVMPRKMSFRQMIRSRSSISKSSHTLPHTLPSVAETLKSPNQSGDEIVAKGVKQSSIVVTSTSPARTMDLCFSNDSSRTEPELAAIAAKKWKSAVDKTTGKTYFYNKVTKEVTWDAPDGFVEQEQPNPVWKTAFDSTSGKKYYYNRQTKEVTWKKPGGFITA